MSDKNIINLIDAEPMPDLTDEEMAYIRYNDPEFWIKHQKKLKWIERIPKRQYYTSVTYKVLSMLFYLQEIGHKNITNKAILENYNNFHSYPAELSGININSIGRHIKFLERDGHVKIYRDMPHTYKLLLF